MKYLKDLNVVNKNILLRVDLNVPKKNNLIIDTSKIFLIKKTIKKLVKNKNKSHIFDPINKEFKDSKNLSISVISDNPIHSDAISTSLISMPIETAIEKIKNFKNSTFLIIEALDNSTIKEIHNNLNTK